MEVRDFGVRHKVAMHMLTCTTLFYLSEATALTRFCMHCNRGTSRENGLRSERNAFVGKLSNTSHGSRNINLKYVFLNV